MCDSFFEGINFLKAAKDTTNPNVQYLDSVSPFEILILCINNAYIIYCATLQLWLDWALLDMEGHTAGLWICGLIERSSDLSYATMRH